MDILFFEFLGQLIFVAVVTYIGATWGIKHPTDPTPLRGIRKKLLGIIFGISAILVIAQKIIQSIPQANSDIWAIVTLVVCIAISRRLCHRMVESKQSLQRA